MSDLQRGSPDDQFIYVDDGDEPRHWSTLLQITPDKLKAAVSAVGASAAKVRTHLNWNLKNPTRTLAMFA